MVQDTYSHLLPSEKDVIKDFFDGMCEPGHMESNTQAFIQ